MVTGLACAEAERPIRDNMTKPMLIQTVARNREAIEEEWGITGIPVEKRVAKQGVEF